MGDRIQKSLSPADQIKKVLTLNLAVRYITGLLSNYSGFQTPQLNLEYSNKKYENGNNLVNKNLLHQHKAMFSTQIILKITIWKLQIVVQFNISYVIRMSIVCTRMSFVCHSYVLVCHSYVTCMYSYVIRMSLVCTRMSSVCYSYVLVCHPYVTCMYSHVTRMSLVCGFTIKQFKWTHFKIVVYLHDLYFSFFIQLPW